MGQSLVPYHDLAQKVANEAVFEAYPSLTREDVQACLALAAEMTKERILPIEVTY